jgi:hypothetical protein
MSVPSPAGGAPSGRLGQGELRRRVAAHLVAHPRETLTPGEIARALDRSAGAVGNALDTLTEQGHAEQVGSRPRRYRVTPTSIQAAKGAATIPPTPRTAPTAPTRTTASPERTAPVGSPKTTTAVRRPNGQSYHPRTLAELPDVDALRRLRAAGIPALLYGPPGTGKTSLVEAAFSDLITVAGDGDTAVADFVGEYTQAPGGGYEFVYGPLVTAMTEGRALLIDDATLVSPKVRIAKMRRDRSDSWDDLRVYNKALLPPPIWPGWFKERKLAETGADLGRHRVVLAQVKTRPSNLRPGQPLHGTRYFDGRSST